MLWAEPCCLCILNCDINVGRAEGEYKTGEQLAGRKMEQEACHLSKLPFEMNPNTALCFWIWIKLCLLIGNSIPGREILLAVRKSHERCSCFHFCTYPLVLSLSLIYFLMMF